MTRRSFARTGRGFHAVGIWRSKAEVNIGTLWRSALLYDAAFVFTIGRRYEKQSSDTPGTPNHIPLFHFADLGDLIGHLPHSCPLVGVELDGRAVPLDRFVHPERACYLLGAEDHGLTAAAMDRCHHVVRIPSARPASMNVAVAGSLVLYDRHVKAAVTRAGAA